MTDWKKIDANGDDYWLSEEYGNVLKVSNVYVAMFPKIVKLGPFKTLEQAQHVLENNTKEFDKYISDFNTKLIEDMKVL